MRRITILFLVAVLVVALTAGAAMAKPGKNKGKGKGKEKVVLCHKGTTIKVAKSAEKGHLKHGDPPGACAAPTPTA